MRLHKSRVTRQRGRYSKVHHSFEVLFFRAFVDNDMQISKMAKCHSVKIKFVR